MKTLLVFAIGYTLGAKAGRQRYEQIRAVSALFLSRTEDGLRKLADGAEPSDPYGETA